MSTHYHSEHPDGWLCEATGKIARQVWTCHMRWTECGHPRNECPHCSTGGKSIAGMLHALNEDRKRSQPKT